MKEMLVAAYVDPRQVTDEEARQFFADQGCEPTNEEVAARVGQGEETFETDTQTGVEGYVDPRQVTEDEARMFFSDTFNNILNVTFQFLISSVSPILSNLGEEILL